MKLKKTKVKVEFEVEFEHDDSWSEEELKMLARAYTTRPKEKYLSVFVPGKNSYMGLFQAAININSAE